MILIDGHNLFFKLRGRRSVHGQDLLTMADRIADSRWSDRTVVLVCDGDPPPGVLAAWAERRERDHDLTFQFSGSDREADDLIESMLVAARRPAGILVVSSDRRLRAAARAVGAELLDAETFADHLLRPNAAVDRRPRGHAVPLSRGEVAVWLAEFGLEPDGRELARPSTRPGTRAGVRAKIPASPTSQDKPGNASVSRAKRPARVDLSESPGMAEWLRLFPPTPRDVRDKGGTGQPERRTHRDGKQGTRRGPGGKRGSI